MGQVEEVGGAAKVNEVVIAALNRALADVAARAAEEDVASEVALNAALYLRDLGRLGEARALCERVAAARRVAEAAGEGAVGGALHARGCVGNIMRMQGELEGARAALEEAVAGWAAVPGSERDWRALGAKMSLAGVMLAQNELEGAQALYEAVVEGYEAVYGGRPRRRWPRRATCPTSWRTWATSRGGGHSKRRCSRRRRRGSDPTTRPRCSRRATWPSS